jgi:hypothetical protein
MRSELMKHSSMVNDALHLPPHVKGNALAWIDAIPVPQVSPGANHG